MRRVAVTGLGIVSSIGSNANEVLASLREAKSGVVFAEDYAKLGFRCQVKAPAKIEDWESMVDRRAARFLAPGTAYAHIAMEQAIADAGLAPEEVSDEIEKLIPLILNQVDSTAEGPELIALGTAKGPMRLGPFSRVVSAAETMALVEGPPEPTIRPTRSLETSSGPRPASTMAWSMAMWP